ncbi:TIGR03773 family transporter-associated surface protein [Actinoplanes sp. NPDC051861]|uniref:TIGR03773 family transporter-associated surface protein n=1 Tax=Actinoplanes sp. NPDC051861 TaxID=3155170 RepID=UPI00341EE4D2
MIRSTAAATAAALLALLPGAAPSHAAPGEPDVDGADLVSVSTEGGKVRLAFRERGATGGTDPDRLRFTARAQPVGAVPADAAFDFLGRPGRPVWALWQGGHGFPSIDTTRVRDAGTVSLDLVGVEGPGSFAAYTVSPWGRPTLLFDSDSDSASASDGDGGDRAAGVEVRAGRRTGGLVWLFDAAGEYRVKLRATAENTSDEATYVVNVPSATPAQKTAATGAASAAASAAGVRVIADGHVDMGPQLSGGALTIRLKDDATSPPTWREPADVILKVTDKARIEVPAGEGYAFLGTAGDPIHLLPQAQQSGIVWPGWNTQHDSVVKGTRGNVTWRLKSVAGPGAVKLFLTGSFGAPEVIFDSAEKLPQQLAIAPNTHAHGNWAFTKPGRYRLSVEMTATTTAGETVSDTKTLTFAVGDSTSTGETGGGSETQSGGLASTGTNIAFLAAAGVVLLATGTAAVLITRRRRPS